MTEPDDIRIVETAPDADAAGDVIDGRRPPRRWSMHPSWLAGLLAAALLAGIGIGYAIGHGTARDRRAAATPPPRVTTQAHLPQLAVSGPTCAVISARTARVLTVGVRLVNNGSRPAVLSAVRSSFPLGGLHQTGASQVGECGQATQAVYGHPIQPSESAWLSLNLDVLVRCPAPLPVSFEIDYTVDGASVTQSLTPFPDLGGVDYPGCPR